MNDGEERELPHSELTSDILGCCFEVMKELGSGFLERVYKNALLIAMRQKGLQVEVEHSYEVVFRGKVIGRYNADLVVSQRICERTSAILIFSISLYRFYRCIVLIVELFVRSKKLQLNRLKSLDALGIPTEPYLFLRVFHEVKNSHIA